MRTAQRTHACFSRLECGNGRFEFTLDIDPCRHSTLPLYDPVHEEFLTSDERVVVLVTPLEGLHTAFDRAELSFKSRSLRGVI